MDENGYLTARCKIFLLSISPIKTRLDGLHAGAGMRKKRLADAPGFCAWEKGINHPSSHRIRYALNLEENVAGRVLSWIGLPEF